ncbi:3-dehydro-L-gulonate 2-dehydrogenase [Shivajiella indica]|uniref:3-dehydro-L-gulonate 2-dehydrogenase n=1 Tax=Shivajiella indica TaxID=872115 RepID=A0ABW5B7C2_9BACT
MRVSYQEVIQVLEKIFESKGFEAKRAGLCARLFAKASLEGVPSHGLDRVPVFLEMIRKNRVFPSAEPGLLESFGFFERWSGNFGPGPLNAQLAMDRAMEIAKEFGIGMLALQDTNHWMRAGNYGWQAVDAGFIGICFTNTKPNMPAWGGKEPKLGNNPLVIGIPRKKGAIVLDMAMSQFSYGKMNTYLREGKSMPFEAGFDQEGNLTKEPKAVIENELALAIGLWKGAGLSLVLDMLVSVLSGGKATHEIGKTGAEFGLSQVFIALDPKKLGMQSWLDDKLDAIIEDLKSSQAFGAGEIRYPGEKVGQIRSENLKTGIPVDPNVWEKIIKELK